MRSSVGCGHIEEKKKRRLYSVRADDNLLLIDNLGDVIIQAPGEQDDGGAAVDEAEQEVVERASRIVSHALVMLVDDDAAAEEFAEQHEGCVLQKTHAVACDGQVAGLRVVEHQLSQRARKTSDKAQGLLHQQQGREVVGFCAAAGGGQIDIATVKGRVDALAVLDLLTHHAGTMHRRGQGHDEENAIASLVAHLFVWPFFTRSSSAKKTRLAHFSGEYAFSISRLALPMSARFLP